MLNKLLVLADGTDPNQPALRRALSCVSDEGVIEVFSAAYEPLLEGYLGNKDIYEPLRRRVLQERQQRVDDLVRAVEGWGVKALGRAVWAHPLHAAVTEEVARQGSELVVAAPENLHQGSEPTHRGLSHSDWQMVTKCPAPLLVVRSDGQAKYRKLVAAVDPFHTFAKPASLDREILAQARVMQEQTGAKLTVLYCYPRLDYFGADLHGLPPQDGRFVDSRREVLQALCEECGIDVGAAKLVPGEPHGVLRDLQQRGEVDLIVMGALARGRLAELVIGSTAARVLHDGRTDVLVVKPSSASRAEKPVTAT